MVQHKQYGDAVHETWIGAWLRQTLLRYLELRGIIHRTAWYRQPPIVKSCGAATPHSAVWAAQRDTVNAHRFVPLPRAAGLCPMKTVARHKTGAANIEESAHSHVEGVLYEVTPAIRNALRKKEGWPRRYRETNVAVEFVSTGAIKHSSKPKSKKAGTGTDGIFAKDRL